MTLSESKQKLETTNHYLRLNARLEDVVEESEVPFVGFAREFLEVDAKFYEKSISYFEKAVALEAQADGKVAQAIQSLQDQYSIDYDEATKRFDELGKENPQERKRKYLYEVAKQTALGIISLPFSRRISSKHLRSAQSYLSMVKTISRTQKTKKRADEIEQKNLQERIKLEQEQAAASTRLQERGYDEKISDVIALSPEKLFYATLEFLKDKYQLD
jgi:hypothetical protein